jgi:hypothetical protein
MSYYVSFIIIHIFEFHFRITLRQYAGNWSPFSTVFCRFRPGLAPGGMLDVHSMPTTPVRPRRTQAWLKDRPTC